VVAPTGQTSGTGVDVGTVIGVGVGVGLDVGVGAGLAVAVGNGVAVGIGVKLGGEVGVPLRATAVASFSTTNGWPGSGVMTGVVVGVAFGVSAGTEVSLDIATIVATRVASTSGVGVGIVAEPPHAVISNIRAVDSTSSFMDISFISTRPRLYLLPHGTPSR